MTKLTQTTTSRSTIEPEERSVITVDDEPWAITKVHAVHMAHDDAPSTMGYTLSTRRIRKDGSVGTKDGRYYDTNSPTDRILVLKLLNRAAAALGVYEICNLDDFLFDPEAEFEERLATWLHCLGYPELPPVSKKFFDDHESQTGLSAARAVITADKTAKQLMARDADNDQSFGH